MYGRGAWSKLLGFAERTVLSNSPPAKVILKEAGLLVKAEQKLTASLAKDAEKALATLGGKGAVTVPSRSAAEKLLLEELRKLGSAKAVIKELDELALKRVVDAAATKAGPSVAMAKGQLLEEFKEARTVRLLQEHLGVKALGLEAGKMRPQYFPGHMLRDDAGRKITDGLVARRVASGKVQQAWYGKRSPEQTKKIEGVLDVLAVDECKGGRASARDLGYMRDVTTADRVVLDAVAVKRFEKAKRQAATAGKPLTTTLEDIQKDVAKEYKMGEMGGQARADVERLDAFEDGSLPSIFVGDAEYPVRLKSISSTKIFGVLPKDVAKSSGALVRKLQSQGLNFEVLGINIIQKELEDVAAEVLQKAATAK